MKLYLISQDFNTGYDTYDSAVVAAKTKEEAARIHPKSSSIKVLNDRFLYEYDFGDWAESPSQVTVQLIGLAVKGTKAGCILASFNAG